MLIEQADVVSLTQDHATFKDGMLIVVDGLVFEIPNLDTLKEAIVRYNLIELGLSMMTGWSVKRLVEPIVENKGLSQRTENLIVGTSTLVGAAGMYAFLTH